MRNRERGSALIIATIVVLVIAVIGVGMVRFTQRGVAGATAGLRADATSACAEAARRLLQSRFHALGASPTEVEVLNVVLDGTGGRQRALGGHIGADPSGTLLDVKQVEKDTRMIVDQLTGDDLSNRIVANSGTGGSPYRVTVHCQEGDSSSPTSGRQLEIEFGVKFGL
jgi:hypothetical protein